MAKEIKDKIKKPRQRSPNYPVIGLEKAVELADKLRKKYGDHDAPANLVHSLWNFSEGSAAGNQHIAALKAYGLINVSGPPDQRRVVISSDGDHIVRRAPDCDELLKKAVLAPSVHGEILKHYGSKGLPADDLLKTYLVWERPKGQRFNEDTVGTFIKRFRASLAFSGNGLSGKNEGRPEDEVDADDEPEGDANEHESETQAKTKPVTALPPTKAENVVIRDFPIPLMGGGLAVVKVPVPMSESDFDQITGTLKAWRTALVRQPKENNPDDVDE